MSQAVISNNKSLSVEKLALSYTNTIPAFTPFTYDVFVASNSEYVEVDYLSFVTGNSSGTRMVIFSPDINFNIYDFGVTDVVYSRQAQEYQEFMNFANQTAAYPSYPKKIRIPPGATIRFILVSSSASRTINFKIHGTRFINSP